jgi:hypothetical protein
MPYISNSAILKGSSTTRYHFAMIQTEGKVWILVVWSQINIDQPKNLTREECRRGSAHEIEYTVHQVCQASPTHSTEKPLTT